MVHLSGWKNGCKVELGSRCTGSEDAHAATISDVPCQVARA
jgi:hypothetical protein